MEADQKSTTTSPPSSTADAEDIEAAIERGRQAGELFDLRLREKESKEREAKRTATHTVLRMPRIEELTYDGLSRESLIRDLREQVERLATFERVVLSSRSWRWIQRFRRILGRR